LLCDLVVLILSQIIGPFSFVIWLSYIVKINRTVLFCGMVVVLSLIIGPFCFVIWLSYIVTNNRTVFQQLLRTCRDIANEHNRSSP
jgi:hypothetical protein